MGIGVGFDGMTRGTGGMTGAMTRGTGGMTGGSLVTQERSFYVD